MYMSPIRGNAAIWRNNIVGLINRFSLFAEHVKWQQYWTKEHIKEHIKSLTKSLILPCCIYMIYYIYIYIIYVEIQIKKTFIEENTQSYIQ